MASRTTLPAKLTRPSGAGLLARERLFRLLDAMRSSRFIWVSGPGGAGKTSLVSSWVEAKGHAGTWYQVDSGDEDPATSFHYLLLLSKAIAPRRSALPRLTPECLPALDLFVRRFFEHFFALFKGPFVMVFDSCHEARPESSFPIVLSGALNALPQDGLIICMSREEPPPTLARWSADHQFSRIGWDDLQFVDEEARGLARLSGERDVSALGAINALARGWAAGLRLLLRARSIGLDVGAGSAQTMQALFDYFAAEIFNKTAADVRDFLLRTSLFPKVTPELAQQLCGYDKAKDTLAWLYRNRFFTEQRRQIVPQTSYEYHPLFREFLLDRAREAFAETEFLELQKRAAALLKESGQADEAAALWRNARDWPALQQLVCEQAPALVAQGRIATLEEWILALPESYQTDAAWIILWLGVSRNFRDPPLGRLGLERSYQRFRRDGDMAGAFLAVANLIGSYFIEWGDARPLDRWIDEFESLFDSCGGVIPEAVEVAVFGSLQGLMYRRPDHPMLPSLVRRAETLLRELPDATQRLIVAPLVLQFAMWSGNFSRAYHICMGLVGAVGPDVPISSRIFFLIWQGILTGVRVDFEAARQSFKSALELARDSGLHIFDAMIYAQMAGTALVAGRPDEAERALDTGWPLLHPGRVVDAQFYRFLRASLLSLRGRTSDAVAAAREAALPEIGLGAPFGAAYFRTALGHILMADGQCAEAREHLETALQFGRRMPSDSIQFPALMGLAWIAIEAGDDAAEDLLKEGLAIGRRQDFKFCPPLFHPGVLSRLCAEALARRIETEYACTLIRARKLVPPADQRDIEGWPWMVRVYTLGRFAVLIDDKPLTFPTRAQRKPLELLKALIALGGRKVAIATLAGQLWPDHDGDAAQNACSIAIHRLRRLLGDDSLLAVQEGKITFPAQHTWVDVWAFERLVTKIDGLAQAAEMDPAEIKRITDRLLKTYLGNFLGGEEGPWAIAHRERLRSKFLRTGSAIGARLESTQQLDDAIDLYRRVIELDTLAEPFHRGLMRCLKALGRGGEALEAYRRCRDILSVTLGVEPSEETQALYRSLKS